LINQPIMLSALNAQPDIVMVAIMATMTMVMVAVDTVASVTNF
jgi:hypothetical protein